MSLAHSPMAPRCGSKSCHRHAMLLIQSLILCSLISVIVGQMVPISEVKTHPPSKSDATDNSDRRTKATTTTSTETAGDVKSHPFGQDKINAHTKIAAAHLKEQQDEYFESHHQRASFPTVETDQEGRKIIRKDKSPDLQNPLKHSSDQHLLKFLLDQYIQISTSSTAQVDLDLQIEILTNIQYFAHKYENGRDLFQATNALQTILLPGLNSTHYEIRQCICSIFAVAGQNNLAVQELSMKHGVLRQLIHIMNTDAKVRPKALYALSSLLRNYPEGQLKFMQDGGVQILVNIAFLSETRQKSLTLLIDLIKEQKYRDGSSGASSEELSNNSAASDHNLIITSLRQSEWCGLLTDNVQNLDGFSQDDQMLIVDAIYSSLDLNICATPSIANYERELRELLTKYEKSAGVSESESVEQPSESVDDDFDVEDDELRNGIELLTRILERIKTEEKKQESATGHDEL